MEDRSDLEIKVDLNNIKGSTSYLTQPSPQPPFCTPEQTKPLDSKRLEYPSKFRSASYKYSSTKKQECNLDGEQALQQLKKDFNKLKAETTLLRTKIAQQNVLIVQQTEDLWIQQTEIDNMSAGRPIQPGFFEQTSVRHLKRQLREERLANKGLLDDIDTLKAQLKSANNQEATDSVAALKAELAKAKQRIEQQATKAQLQVDNAKKRASSRDHKLLLVKEQVIKQKANKIEEASIREQELNNQLKEAQRNNNRLLTAVKSYQSKIVSLTQQLQNLETKPVQSPSKPTAVTLQHNHFSLATPQFSGVPNVTTEGNVFKNLQIKIKDLPIVAETESPANAKIIKRTPVLTPSMKDILLLNKLREPSKSDISPDVNLGILNLKSVNSLDVIARKLQPIQKFGLKQPSSSTSPLHIKMPDSTPSNMIENPFNEDSEYSSIEADDAVTVQEEEMLDIAEKILTEVAQKLNAQNHLVEDIFGLQYQTTVLKFEDKANVQVILPQTFLDCLYRIKIAKLTEIQVACLLRVIGKPDLNESILYEELKMLLENFGVQKKDNKLQPPDQIRFKLEKDDIQDEESPMFKPKPKTLPYCGYDLSNRTADEVESVSDKTTSNQLVASRHMPSSNELNEINLEGNAVVDRFTLRKQIIDNKRSALFTLVKDMAMSKTGFTPLTQVKSKLVQLSKSKTVQTRTRSKDVDTVTAEQFLAIMNEAGTVRLPPSEWNQLRIYLQLSPAFPDLLTSKLAVQLLQDIADQI